MPFIAIHSNLTNVLKTITLEQFHTDDNLLKKAFKSYVKDLDKTIFGVNFKPLFYSFSLWNSKLGINRILSHTYLEGKVDPNFNNMLAYFQKNNIPLLTEILYEQIKQPCIFLITSENNPKNNPYLDKDYF